MFFHKKISSDVLLLVLLIVRLRLDSDISLLNDRYIRAPESREVFLGSSSAHTQITFHSPYSNIQYPHPKSLEYNEQEEAAILFNRLNYINSVRERRGNLIAYYASSPGVQNSGSAIENANAEPATGGDNVQGSPSLPTTAEGTMDPVGDTSGEREPTIQDLSPEDMDLIEILWKQDIDMGVSRDAYDSRTFVEFEKIKDVENTKEYLQDFYVPGDDKNTEESESAPSPLDGLNYTVDSETGEFVLDQLSALREDEMSGAQLLDNDTFTPLNCDSYLPLNEDDIQLANLTDVFPPEDFAGLSPENYTDSEFILSQIEDIEKELQGFNENDPEQETMYTQPEDVFPNIDDCWPDTTTMLPLLALGNSHQSSFVPLSTISESTFQNNNPVLAIPSRSNEDFTSIIHGTSLEASAVDETFHSIPVSLGPSSVGCALAESIATLHNDTDPIPTSGLLNTVYNPDLPDLLYSNQTLANPQNELLIQNLFTDDDFQLTTMSAEANQRLVNDDHIDVHSDTSSLASGRVPSVSDCPDWIDSCSESSHHGESLSIAPHSRRGNSFSHGQNSELYHSNIPHKRHRHLENNNVSNPDFSGAAFDHSNRSDQQYFPIKTEYHDDYENATVSVNNLPTCKKFDYSATRSSASVGNNILQHNHSYHLPFASSESRFKPIFRDKVRLSCEDDSSNKDEKKAKELKLPISIEDIINLAIEEYNERLSKYELTDAQLNLIRDIRRRGKNKVAAQNCRKRKMDQISSLQQDLEALQNEKMQLKSKQDNLLQEKHNIDDKYAQLCHIITQYSQYNLPENVNSLHHYNSQMTTNATPDAMSEDDSDLSRGARTKRKIKK